MTATKMVRLKRISVMIIGMNLLYSLKVSSSIGFGFFFSNLHFALKRAQFQSNINLTTNMLVLILYYFSPLILGAYLNLTINRTDWR